MIDIGIHIYVRVFVAKKINRTLVIDPHIQTFVVGLLVIFID